MFWILDENKKTKQVELLEFANWFETADRILKNDIINNFLVSTVFMGFDLGLGYSSEPLLFETMIFENGEAIGYCDRYSTWEDAIAGHDKACQWVKDGCKDSDD